MKNTDPILVALSDSPIPATSSVHYLQTADHIYLRYAMWEPEFVEKKDARGIVVILQGRGEFIEKYFETIDELRHRGFYVVAFDWRGQGGSQRLIDKIGGDNVSPGHVQDFVHYQRDLDTVLEAVNTMLPPLPRYALCHSMGGTIALLRAARKENAKEFTRIVALAPMVALSSTLVPGVAPFIAEVGRRLGLSKMIVPGGKRIATVLRPFTGNRLTHDRLRFQRVRSLVEFAPWLGVGDPTLGWLAAAFRAMKRLALPRFALSIRTPLLVLAAGGDQVVSTPAIERFCARLKTGNAIVIPGARHEILLETDEIRTLFWAAFDAFIPGDTLMDADQPFKRDSAA